MSFIGNELVPNMTAVLDNALKTKILEMSEYNKGFYDGAREMLKAFAEEIGNNANECVIVYNGMWHDLMFKPVENKDQALTDLAFIFFFREQNSYINEN